VPGLTDPDEARRMLDEQVARLQALPYAELRTLAEEPPRWSFLGGRIQIGSQAPEPEERVAPSGRLYQFEMFAVVEGGDTVHVFVSLLEECRPYRTLDTDFIVAE
jgi:hypothetical protein